MGLVGILCLPLWAKVTDKMPREIISVKIFFILRSFIVVVPQQPEVGGTDVVEIPVTYFNSKQVPPCQKSAKKPLMPMLFKVNGRERTLMGENW